MYQHRLFQQREMSLQADYVGMDAFGAEASEQNIQKFNHFKQEQDDFNNTMKKVSKEQMFIDLLKKYDNTLLRTMAHLLEMAKRYDRINEIILSEEIDDVQKQILIHVYESETVETKKSSQTEKKSHATNINVGDLSKYIYVD